MPDTILQYPPIQAWLTASRLRAINSERVHIGQIASTARLTVKSTDSDEIFRTIVKYPHSSIVARAIGWAGGLYETESFFYQSLVRLTPARTARCLHNFIDAEQHEFLLVLEDVGLSEVEGSTGDQGSVSRGLKAAAELHRTSSDGVSQALLVKRAHRHTHAGRETLGSATLQRFLRLYDTEITDEVRDSVARLSRWIRMDWPNYRMRPTFTHGDLRLPNIVQTADADVLIDWQNWTVASPGADIAYLVGSSLTSTDRRLFGDDMLHRYLEYRRVPDLPRAMDDLMFDYRLGAAKAFANAVLSATVLGPRREAREIMLELTHRFAVQAADLKCDDLFVLR